MTPIRVAYADPPYIGRARYYPERTEVDHAALVAQLVAEFPAGWALSCSSPSLRALLPLCPPATRVAAWVKPWCSWKPTPQHPYAWEPLLVCGGRPPSRLGRDRVRDWLAVSVTTGCDFRGAKPEPFARWLFALLGLEAGDELVDLFPGTGAIGAAWDRYCRQGRLPLVNAV
jgi:hypothetical protein